MNRPLRVAVIGATGSVGAAVLDICARFPQRFEVRALAARSNESALLELFMKYKPAHICLYKPTADSGRLFAEFGVTFHHGPEGLADIATFDDIDHVVFASSGTEAIKALQAALISGKDISIANKESIVATGPWIMPSVSRPDQLRPVDSEHSAIWQCLRDEKRDDVSHIYLTASGGPFRDWSCERMATVTPEAALNHPVWKMGPKVTIDSATLMNKGIECIEAMQLFDMPADRVGALIHPKSQVHGIVQFKDATMKFLFSSPDMRLPAAAALAWPDRLPLVGDREIGLPEVAKWSLDFYEPDYRRFPCLDLAMEAGRRGGAYPPLLIGADNSAVDSFLKKRITFLQIPRIIENVLEGFTGASPNGIDDAIDLIEVGERLADKIINSGGTV